MVTQPYPAPRPEGNGEMVTIARKNKTRRGVRGGRNCKSSISKDDIWTIYQSNIRGYESKASSFHTIIGNILPSVIVLNETHLKHAKNIKISGYNSYNRNRQNKFMGGIATAIKNADAIHALKVKEGESDNEYLVTRHSQLSQ